MTSLCRQWCYFNPRSREGSDTRTINDGLAVLISIHAPEKGATKCWLSAGLL